MRRRMSKRRSRRHSRRRSKRRSRRRSKRRSRRRSKRRSRRRSKRRRSRRRQQKDCKMTYDFKTMAKAFFNLGGNNLFAAFHATLPSIGLETRKINFGENSSQIISRDNPYEKKTYKYQKREKIPRFSTRNKTDSFYKFLKTLTEDELETEVADRRFYRTKIEEKEVESKRNFLNVINEKDLLVRVPDKIIVVDNLPLDTIAYGENEAANISCVNDPSFFVQTMTANLTYEDEEDGKKYKKGSPKVYFPGTKIVNTLNEIDLNWNTRLEGYNLNAMDIQTNTTLLKIPQANIRPLKTYIKDGFNHQYDYDRILNMRPLDPVLMKDEFGGQKVVDKFAFFVGGQRGKFTLKVFFNYITRTDFYKKLKRPIVLFKSHCGGFSSGFQTTSVGLDAIRKSRDIIQKNYMFGQGCAIKLLNYMKNSGFGINVALGNAQRGDRFEPTDSFYREGKGANIYLRSGATLTEFKKFPRSCNFQGTKNKCPPENIKKSQKARLATSDGDDFEVVFDEHVRVCNNKMRNLYLREPERKRLVGIFASETNFSHTIGPGDTENFYFLIISSDMKVGFHAGAVGGGSFELKLFQIGRKLRSLRNTFVYELIPNDGLVDPSSGDFFRTRKTLTMHFGENHVEIKVTDTFGYTVVFNKIINTTIHLDSTAADEKIINSKGETVCVSKQIKQRRHLKKLNSR